MAVVELLLDFIEKLKINLVFFLFCRWRVGLVYLGGVLMGSLGSSLSGKHFHSGLMQFDGDFLVQRYFISFQIQDHS